MSNIEQLIEIFEENRDKRICVLGATCTGKTTLIKGTNIGLDMDEEIFPLLTEEETEYVCRTPWTQEIGNRMDELVRTKLSIKQGTPMFGTVLLDCDLIVYLHLIEDLLLASTKLRNTHLSNAKNMQLKIEEEIKKSNIPIIYVEVQNENKKVK